jgi:hypothetical protein
MVALINLRPFSTDSQLYNQFTTCVIATRQKNPEIFQIKSLLTTSLLQEFNFGILSANRTSFRLRTV